MTNTPVNDPFEDLGGNAQIDETVPGTQGRAAMDRIADDEPRSAQGGRSSQQDADVIGAGAPGTAGQIKDPEDWVTGAQPMTDAQRGYLDSLAKQAGETLPADLTKAEASEEIDRLQDETGRSGQNNRG